MIRFFDFIFSMAAILFLSPVLLVIITILKLTGEREAFYLQKRMGKNEIPFDVFKFVTMVKDSEKMQGGAVTKKDDPRVLPIGKFLRKTKLNELPQLFNILIGDMTFVGPRPQTVSQYYNFSEQQRKIISNLKPGLTGIGSLIFRDEEGIMHSLGIDYNEAHDKVITPYKGDLECWFYKNKNILLYFKLIFLTAESLFLKHKKYRLSFNSLPTPPTELKTLV